MSEAAMRPVDHSAAAASAEGNAAPRVLVACIGNVFWGDDGFGVEVARRLMPEQLPPQVRVADFGIRSLHLAYELLEGGYDPHVLASCVAETIEAYEEGAAADQCHDHETETAAAAEEPPVGFLDRGNGRRWGWNRRGHEWNESR